MRIRMLGPLEVGSGRQWRRLGAAKWRALLATLLVSTGRPVSVDRLVEELWPDGPPRTAVNQIHGYVARLRRALDDPNGDLLRTRSPGYELAVDEDDLDATRFEALTDQGDTALRSGDLEGAERLLTEALALWRGPAFVDVDPSTEIQAAAERLNELRLATTERLLEVGLTLGRHAELVAELRTAVAEHPFRERLWGLLILALYRSGRQANALEAYQTVYRTLSDELGVEPSRPLRELHEQVLGNDSALDVPARNDPPPTLAGVPRQLPAVARHFVGRERELKVLDELADSGLDADAIVITAIAGAAGIGKTTTAIRWAHRVAPRYPDGQLYVNLRGFDPTGTPASPSDALRGFLDALDVRPERMPQTEQAKSALFRSLLADKRVLVVLDNARDVDQVRPLIPASPACLVVVTSRERLTGLLVEHGAQPLTLDLLGKAEAEQLLSRHLGPDRVAAESEAAAALLERCAGLPLALAIVCARAAADPELGLGALAAQLADSDERLDALDTGEEVTTARAVFSWSYQSQPVPAQRMFRLLGLHPGPDVTVPVAASLAATSPSEARRLLRGLARAHLISERAPGRYDFHDLFRAYAAELAHEHDGEDERRTAVRRLVDHYLHTAHPAALQLSSHRDPIRLDAPLPGVRAEALADLEEALNWFSAARPALLAVVDLAAAYGHDAQCWQLAWALVDFLDWRGHWQDWVDTQNAALAAARRLGARDEQARTHRYLASAYIELGDNDEAYEHLTQALALQRELGAPAGQAQAHIGLGGLRERQRRWDDARDHAVQALELFRVAGHRLGLANALNSAGWAEAMLGNHVPAVEYAEQALEQFEELDHPHGLAATWPVLGYVHHQQGDFTRGIDCYQRSLDLYHGLGGDRYYQAEVLDLLADVHRDAGDRAAARDAWRQALEILDELEHPKAAEVRAKLA